MAETKADIKRELEEQKKASELTQQDIIRLQEYLELKAELEQRKPCFFLEESPEHEQIWRQTLKTGIIPEEYKDRIGTRDIVVYSEMRNGKLVKIPEGKTKKGYYDILYAKWDQEVYDLNNRYFPVIMKALEQNDPKATLGTLPLMQIDDIIKATVQSETANAPRIESIKPLWHTMANNALINNLTMYPVINAGDFDMNVINQKGKRKEITTYTIVSYDQAKDGAGNLITSKLTEYERQVSDAIISIWEETRKNGLPPEFTTDMVYRAMPGSGDKPSPQQAGAITKTIEKFRHLHIYLDITEEMRARGINTDKVIYDDFFLSVAKVTRKIKNGGQTVIAYHLHTEPLILSYCKQTNQLITVSAKWLEVKKVKSGKASKENMAMTQERQAITGYLIRRIAVMKNDKHNKKPTQSNTILFSTLFDDIGAPEPDKKKAAAIRDFCFDVLDYYKAEGIIADYERQTKGRSITGIIIKL